MPREVDKDLVGALASSAFSNMDLQVKRMNRGAIRRLIVETEQGVSVLAEMEMGTMVVFAQGQVNIEQVLAAVSAITGK